MQKKLDMCFSVVLVIPQKEIFDEERILKGFWFLFTPKLLKTSFS